MRTVDSDELHKAVRDALERVLPQRAFREVPIEGLRERDAARYLGISRQMLRLLEAKRGGFPQRRRLGPQTVVWLRSELDDWLQRQPRARE